MDKHQSWSKALITAIVCITLGVFGYFGYDMYKSYLPAKVQERTENELKMNMSVGDRLMERSLELVDKRERQIYHQLTNVQLQFILEKIGANASISDIVSEFESNLNLYISSEIAEQFENAVLRGPYAELVDSVNLSVALKPDSIEERKMKITPQ